MLLVRKWLIAGRESALNALYELFGNAFAGGDEGKKWVALKLYRSVAETLGQDYGPLLEEIEQLEGKVGNEAKQKDRAPERATVLDTVKDLAGKMGLNLPDGDASTRLRIGSLLSPKQILSPYQPEAVSDRLVEVSTFPRLTATQLREMDGRLDH